MTEQGEMITQNFGTQDIAQRTMDILLSGVLSESFKPMQAVKPEWKAAMQRMSTTSCEAYRAVVQGEPRFVPYFRSATPELELAGLNVGSRPAKRNPKGGVESLRAIPWVFSWTQTRLNLPVWLGVGDAIALEMEEEEKKKLLVEMYQEWSWFGTLVDLLEMVMAKSDGDIAANYDRQLLAPGDVELHDLGEGLRKKLKTTESMLLAVSRHKDLADSTDFLSEFLPVRNSYIDPLNVIQAEVLKRLRISMSDDSKPLSAEAVLLRDALLVSINGIANGMRNSG